MYTFTVNEDGSISHGDNNGIIYNTAKTIDVEIIKKEKDTNIPLKGATIALYKEGQNETMQTVTTGENGKGTFTGLRAGTYYYKEVKAPVGYILNEEMYTFTIGEDGSVTYGTNEGIIYNKKKPIDPVEPDDPVDPPEEPDIPDKPTEPDKPEEPDRPTQPDTPSKPQEPTTPNVPVKPNIPNDYIGNLPKTGETIVVLVIAVIVLSGSAIMLTYNYIKMKKERK